MEVNYDAQDQIGNSWGRSRDGQGLHAAGVMEQVMLLEFDRPCLPLNLRCR